MLTIVKEGNKNFQHIDPDFVNPYGASDITAIFDGNITKIRSFSGRVVLNKDGYNLPDVTIIDNTNGGVTNTYPNITSLKQRLINLGYPFAGGSDEVIVNEVAWGSIIGNITNQGDLINLINSAGGSQNFVATANQTSFTITENPDSLSLVFTGKNRSKPTEWTYVGGVLTFTVGLIVGTEVTAVWGGVSNGNSTSTPLIQKIAKGVVLGDSTIANFSGATPLATLLLSATDSSRGDTIANLANSGDTILQQLTAWNADVDKTTYTWAYIQLGLNDTQPANTLIQMKADYQSLITQIKTDNPSCIVIAGTMTPAYQRFIDIDSPNEDLSQALWQGLNDAIIANEFGNDFSINTHTATMANPADRRYLLASYDVGDGVHPNSAGRAENASQVRLLINNIGFLSTISTGAKEKQILSINANFTPTSADLVKHTYYNNTGGTTRTMTLANDTDQPSSDFAIVTIMSTGAGGITAVAGAGVTLWGVTADLTAGQRVSRTYEKVAPNFWQVIN